MRKFRNDAKPIDLGVAKWLYWDQELPLSQVAKTFGVHHTNLLMRFRRFGIPVRSHQEACKIAIRPIHFGINNHSWKGGRYTDKRGYIHVRINGENRYLHRVIAEKILNRPLKRSEAVHHVDGNRSNNVNSNLLICSVKYHHWLHAKMQNFLIGINHKGGQNDR